MWRPLADRVLVRLDAAEEVVTAGGLVLPGRVEQSTNKQATVVAVGHDVKELAAGDRVLMSGYAGTTIEGDEDARIIREGDAMVVLNACE